MKNESKLGVGLKGLSTFFENSKVDFMVPAELVKDGETPDNVQTYKEQEISYIDIDKVHPNPNQPRKKFDEESLKTLADSIKTDGLLQPILVRNTADGYEIIAGERRFRAAKLAEFAQIPTIIKDMSDEQVFQIALIENLQRENLSPIEEAKGYRKLIDDYNYTQKDVADLVHKSRPYVANILRLLSLPDEIQEKVDNGEIPYSQAIQMDAKEGAVKLAKPKFEKEKAEIEQSLLQLQNSLTNILALPVEVKGKNGKGSIVIRYGSVEELDGIMKRLSSL